MNMSKMGKQRELSEPSLISPDACYYVVDCRSHFGLMHWSLLLLSPVRGIKETPIERFTDVKPNLSKLRVFGSWAWAHVPVEKTRGRHKLDARAVKCRFLYYTQGGHAYMLMDEGGNTFEAVSVRFDETLVTQSNGGESEIRPESLDLTDLNDEEEEEEREIAQADVPESDGEDAFEDAGEYKEQEPSDTEEGEEEEEPAPLRRGTRDWKPP